VILIHAFCNWMGFPRFWGRVRAGDMVMGPDARDGKRGENADAAKLSDGRLGVIWTIAYYVLLVAGAVAWRKFLWQWTDSEMALRKF